MCVRKCYIIAFRLFHAKCTKLRYFHFALSVNNFNEQRLWRGERELKENFLLTDPVLRNCT